MLAVLVDDACFDAVDLPSRRGLQRDVEFVAPGIVTRPNSVGLSGFFRFVNGDRLDHPAPRILLSRLQHDTDEVSFCRDFERATGLAMRRSISFPDIDPGHAGRDSKFE